LKEGLAPLYGVYHTLNQSDQLFYIHLAKIDGFQTLKDGKPWTFIATLEKQASMPAIKVLEDGSVMFAYEVT